MTEDRLPLADLLAKAGDGDFLRSVAEAVVQLLMETDVEGVIGAGRHERSGDRTTYRNGYRDRTLDTRLGSLQLRIPKLRQGSYFPPFLEPRKTSEKALVAVIQEAWVSGVSTRRPADIRRRGSDVGPAPPACRARSAAPTPAPTSSSISHLLAVAYPQSGVSKNCRPGDAPRNAARLAPPGLRRPFRARRPSRPLSVQRGGDHDGSFGIKVRNATRSGVMRPVLGDVVRRSP